MMHVPSAFISLAQKDEPQGFHISCVRYLQEPLLLLTQSFLPQDVRRVTGGSLEEATANTSEWEE